MIVLFRAAYSRNGLIKGMTFGLKEDMFVDEAAEKFADAVIMPFARALDKRAQLLTVKRYPGGGR